MRKGAEGEARMVAVFLSGVRGAAQPDSQTGQDLLQAHISGRGVI